MESLHKPMNAGITGTHYDDEKITRIREKIEVVFGSASTMGNKALCERYDITGDGDLIMILR